MIKDIEKFNIATNINEQQLRVTICSSCPHNKFINNEHICEMCACPMEYIVSQKYKECPIGKWSA